jgi:3'-5' exoribonuclease
MKDFYIDQCIKHENETITSSFVVASKSTKSKKNGDPYLALTFSDRTGILDGKMWDGVAEVQDKFDAQDVVKVRGLVSRYNGRMQITVHQIRKVEESEVDYADYLPKTSKNIDELWTTVAKTVASFKNPHLKSLIESFMADPDIERGYKNAPAAKTLHHAFIGGLLEHVVSLMTLVEAVAPLYPQVDRELILTGVFLHDIGKVHELNYSRAFGYSTSGQLLGHMIIELEMLHEKLRALADFPKRLQILIEHLIISHHGQYEFGSPKLPMFPEALMLHYLDDLDSKMETMRAQFEREAAIENEWTSFNQSLSRPLLNVKRFLENGEKETGGK